MYALLRPLFFAFPPHAAHRAAMAALAPVERSRALAAALRSATAPRDPRLVVEAMGLTFPSPIGLAGGFDKNADRAIALAALGFGHLELGTVTARAQEANPAPNLFRLPRDRALVNRLGFPNEGAARVTARIAAKKPTIAAFGVPVGVSIGKSRAVPLDDVDAVVADYLASFAEARRVADFVVVNVSSPNTTGLRAMQGADLARTLLGALAAANRELAWGGGAATERPLLVKIAPDLEGAEIDALADVAAEIGLAGVVATNTTIARAGLATDAATVAAIGAGGLSGPPLRARALDVVARVRRRLGRGPVVIGVGGIEDADHALAMLRAGADVVQLYTGFIYGGPGIAARIARDLLRRMDRHEIPAIGEIARGGVRPDVAAPRDSVG